jgi:hypothetical protein
MAHQRRSLDAPLVVRYKVSDPPTIPSGGPLIDDLPQLKAIIGTDVGLVSRDKESRHVSMTVMREFLGAKAYGMLQTIDGDALSPVTTQSINGTEALLDTWRTNGIASGTTPDYTSGKVTAAVDGVYDVTFHISFSGSLGKTIDLEIFKEIISDSPQISSAEYEIERKLGTGGDVGSASCGGLIELSAGDSVMVYVYSSDGGTSITVHHAQLKVVQI